MKKSSPVFDKRRKRRVIYNDDCGQLYNQTATDIIDDQSFLDAQPFNGSRSPSQSQTRYVKL